MATVMATLVTGSTRHTQALEAALGSVNDRLKQAKRRVRVVVPSKKHRTLHLRATLPPKADEVQGPPRRRYIKLPFEYTQGGIQEAEVQAIELDRDITDWRNGQDFDWKNWKEPEKRKRSDEVETFESLIADLKHQFFEERRDDPRPQKVRRYWQTDNGSYLKKLDQSQPYSIRHMRETIEGLPAKSCSRKKIALACARLMQLKREPVDAVEEIKALGRGYGKKQLNPRDIPSDEEILQDIEKLDEEWKWAFRVLYLYGCRPHELWKGEVMDNCLLQVTEETKTGLRIAMPRAGKKHLVEEWNLFGNQMPDWFGKGAEAPDQNVSMEMNKARHEKGISWAPYDARHAWALSGIRAGTNIRLAAKSMGHRLSEHEDTYLHWISEQEMLEAMTKETT